MKPLAVDLCCGMGGWTLGLQAAGWDVIGFDIQRFAEYPAKLVLQDVRTLDGRRARGKIGLVCASPPCQEFSYRHLPFGRVKNLPPPDESIWRACERFAEEAGVPLILENVIGAQRFMGKSKAAFGPFHLWGKVPTHNLGETVGFKPKWKGFGNLREGHTGRHFYSQSAARKKWSATIAMIPLELSTWIGKSFLPQASPHA